MCGAGLVVLGWACEGGWMQHRRGLDTSKLVHSRAELLILVGAMIMMTTMGVPEYVNCDGSCVGSFEGSSYEGCSCEGIRESPTEVNM